MIPNQWYVILESKEVKTGKPVGVTRMGEKMVLWRDDQGKVTCMIDLCPHRGVALSKGKLIGDCIQCPFHGFQFDPTGRCRLIPANGKNAEPPRVFQVHAFPTREAHDFIYIWWGEPKVTYPELPFFDSINETQNSYSTFRDQWATHYSRAIENQLDVVHLPFVHYNTIGRGNRTLVNGPIWRAQACEGGSDILELWVNNEVDQGQKPLKTKEMPEPTWHPLIQFRFPNIWHNWLSDQLHIFAAFVPINDENTLIYFRTYQKVVRLPVLRRVFNWLNALTNLVIERQDKRVVVTQLPKRSDLHIGERLIQGDGPIIEYRRRRGSLIEAVEVDEISTL